jgi:hypothetical protein
VSSDGQSPRSRSRAVCHLPPDFHHNPSRPIACLKIIPSDLVLRYGARFPIEQSSFTDLVTIWDLLFPHYRPCLGASSEDSFRLIGDSTNIPTAFSSGLRFFSLETIHFCEPPCRNPHVPLARCRSHDSLHIPV